jgi:L-ascorbate metabolism protein UlaG (beta-lactamase superfamily)
MRITHLGHACLLVEMADTRLLVDPGTFADDLGDVRDLAAVLVTHQHPDHLDPERLPDLVAANPGAVVLCDPGSVDVLAGLGVEARSHHGAPTSVGDVTVTPFGQQHALIHDDIARITNVGVRLDAEGEPSFFHPGDALDAEPGEVDVLAFPLQAPWQRSRDMTAFLRRLGAPHAVPVHDGLLQPRGRTLYLNQAGQLGSRSTRIHDLAGAGATEFRVDE